jgi:hypothetical protein
MPSFVWYRHPEEAYQNPYEYDAQAQFSREAHALLEKLYDGLNSYLMRFGTAEETLEKAVWMLQIDALDSLRDALELLNSKRHRPAGRLFRDVVETLDLAAYFWSGTPESKSSLAKWYNNEVIPHRVYREFLKKTVDEKRAEERRDYYHDLSKFTHRSYRALLKSYSVRRGDRLVYDGSARSGRRILPQTIAAYYAIIGDLILQLSKEVVNGGLLTSDFVDTAWKESTELETIPRRFMPRATATP